MTSEPTTVAVQLPWLPHAEMAGNLFVGTARSTLLAWTTINGGIHSETLLAIVGALTGFAAQAAVWNEYIIPKKPMPVNGFVSLQTKAGETYYAGDLLNAYIIPEQHQQALWNFAAAAAVHNGVPATEMPDPTVIFQRAARTLGTPEYHELDIAATNKPHLLPRECVERFWLPLCALLKATNEHAHQMTQATDGSDQLTAQDLPVALSVVAQQLLGATKEVLDLRIGLSIVMQSAIIASKYNAAALQLQPARTDG